MENPGVGAMGKEGLIELQERDTTLSHIQEQVVSEPEAARTQVGYYKKSGVLMRRWRPLDAEGSETWRAVHQIVAPRQYRNEVLSLAHENPLAGHLGINKTYRKVLQHFYWPGLRKDIVKFCTTCHTCQMIGKPNQCNQVAPLIPIPAMEEPFSRVIVDCVGPLPKTKSGNKYLLTIMCSSARFPEAIPLKNIKVPKIFAALIKFFTLVGLPKAIQSDQGSNFMLGIFQQVMYPLGIKQYTSSAYHPQSQGALERFHQTLKNMMRAYCYEQERDWDEGVHLLLLAAREAVQDLLGFSPFELLFGREVREPHKLLKKKWLGEDDQVSLLEQVSQLCNQLMKAGEIARANLKVSQRRMKAWYDQKARKRSFKVGDEVLILLPVQGQPLQARYSGPFTIERKINDIDYIVHTPGRRKEKRLCHINMLKLYQERKSEEETMPSSVAVCSAVVAETSHDMVGDAPKLTNSESFQDIQKKLSHLTPEEQADMRKLLLEFRHLFPDVPSCTNCIYHDVDVGNAAPC